MAPRNSPEAHLPLPAATFHILIALAGDDRHGYAIIQEVAARTRGAVRLSPGTLYRSIERMLEQDYIVELGMRERPPKGEDDPRRRYYRLTPFGRAVAEAETRRLGELLRLAHASGFARRNA